MNVSGVAHRNAVRFNDSWNSSHFQTISSTEIKMISPLLVDANISYMLMFWGNWRASLSHQGKVKQVAFNTA